MKTNTKCYGFTGNKDLWRTSRSCILFCKFGYFFNLKPSTLPVELGCFETSFYPW